jgi:hypothetical protein
MPARRSLRLFADHPQIHLLDASSAPAFAHAWTQQATDDRLAAAEGGIAVGTADSVELTRHTARSRGRSVATAR